MVMAKYPLRGLSSDGLAEGTGEAPLNAGSRIGT